MFKKGQLVQHSNLGLGVYVEKDLHDNESIVSFKDEHGYEDELRISTSSLTPLASQVPNKKNIDDLVDEWHQSDVNIPLHDYLGMSFSEYTKYVEKDILPVR